MSKFTGIVNALACSLWLLIPVMSVGQGNPRAEEFEKIFSYWYKGLEKVRINIGASNGDYLVFQRFYETTIDTVRGRFMRKIGSGAIRSSNVDSAMAEQVKTITVLYTGLASNEGLS